MNRYGKVPLRDKIIWLTSPDHCAQAVLVFVPFWFCFILAMDYDTFATSRSFNMMQMQMTESNWAIFSGILSFIALICWATGNHYALVFQNAILMGWHGLVALCFFLANPISTGSGTYAVLAFAATLRAINLALRRA